MKEMTIELLFDIMRKYALSFYDFEKGENDCSFDFCGLTH